MNESHANKQLTRDKQVSSDAQKNDLEIQLLLSDIERNQSEATKLKLEASEVQKRIDHKWYSGRFLLQAVVGGVVAAALLAAWAIGYLNPILSKQQEITKLEVKELELKTRIQEGNNTILQAELKGKASRLAAENEKMKDDLASLVEQNKLFEVQQNEVNKKAKELRKELVTAKSQYVELSKKHGLKPEDRERYANLAEISERRIESLSSEIEGLKSSREETKIRGEQLKGQLNLRKSQEKFLWCERGKDYGCFSLRYTSECDISCANEVAAVLRNKLNLRVRVSRTSPHGPAGCIGYREDLGGTEEMAKIVQEILGPGYYVGDCKSDGFAINVRAKKLSDT